MADYIPLFQDQAKEIVEHYKAELNKLRTGRASVTLVDEVMVEAYGTRMRLQEVGSISAPDPTLIVISPWDKSLLAAIEKGIMQAELGLMPVVDSEIVRLPVPPLTQEKRQELVKVIYRKLEEAKIMLRNARTDVKQLVEDQKNESGISEDDIAADIETLDKAQKDAVAKLEAFAKEKETVVTTL